MKKTGMLLMAALVCLGAASLLHRPLLSRREAFRPPHQTDLRTAPPIVAFTTVALGGFRGILADLLWLRVSALQDEGKYFEITQLSDWITKLEPTFAEVWGYHAWNMAYNISVLFPAPADRWRWVEHGVRLLREDGIRYNPGDPRLYWELGWLFHHKIAGFNDPASSYYQDRLIEAVSAVLPDGRLDGKTASDAGAVWNAFRLESGAMAALEEAVGPMDWRLPEAHALYWAWQGRAAGGAVPDLMLERLFYQSLMAAVLRGKLVYAPDRGVQVRLIRPDLIGPAWDVLEEARRRFPDDPGIEAATDWFTRQAIVRLYIKAEEGQAAAFLERYRRERPEVSGDLTVFVARQLEAGLLAGSGFVDELQGYYFEAAQARRQGAGEQADRLEALVERLYEGAVRRLAAEGRIVPLPLDQIRERGRGQSAALADGPDAPP